MQAHIGMIAGGALLALSACAPFPPLNPDTSAFPKWERVIQQEGKGELKARLNKLQTELRKVPYVSDQENYGMLDQWATPEEFRRRGGDCEDFAIAAYFALLDQGVPEEAMDITVVTIRPGKVIHAYLRVYGYVMDQRSRTVMTMAQAAELYDPVFGINKQGWRQFRASPT